MKKPATKKRLRSLLILLAWIVFAQVILINISAALYAHKLTHLKTPLPAGKVKKNSGNIFTKTWTLFSGPQFYNQPVKNLPSFNYTTDTLQTSNGTFIETWQAKVDSNKKGTIILFHGLMMNKSSVLDQAIEFLSFGFDVQLVDMRNHGNSGGSTTTFGYREAEEVKIAYDAVKKRGETNIFLWGISMGAVQIIKAVAEYDLAPKGILLEMPFLSLQSHLKGRARTLGFPEQPFAFLTSFWIGVERGFNGLGFEADEYANQISCPVLMHYGELDDLVLQEETEAIFASFPGINKKLVTYENIGHDSFLRLDPATWRRETALFLGVKDHFRMVTGVPMEVKP